LEDRDGVSNRPQMNASKGPLPGASHALKASFDIYIAANAMPRFFDNKGDPTNRGRLWISTDSEIEAMVDIDDFPDTFDFTPELEGYDKTMLWSARFEPEQTRFEA